MRHSIYGTDPSTASVAILVKETSFHRDHIKTAYIDSVGANPAGFIAYSLWYDENGKCQAALAKDYLQTLLLSVQQLGIKILLVTDAKYFKFITGEQKAASSFIGYEKTCMLDGYENSFTVFYVPNYQAAQYNPKTEKELRVGISAFKQYLNGAYLEPGHNIIKHEEYPHGPTMIGNALKDLLQYAELTIDIETRGLKFWKCGIATISFSWDKHSFVSFPVDRGSWSTQVRFLLKTFLEEYEGKLIGQNLNFDFKVLAFELWMKHLQDYKGMIDGIRILTRDFDDTKLVAYLSTNNAVENVLKLKVLSAEYMGNYGQDNIEDTDQIELQDLLQYNGRDCMATWYVFNKYYPRMVTEQQEELYKSLYKPSVITLLQTELVGMPIYPDKVAEAKKQLTVLRDKYAGYISNSTLIKEFQLDVQSRKCQEFTDAAKKKVFTMDDPRIQRLEFNPNSNQQAGDLLYSYLGFPILDYTDTNLPSASGKTLKKLLNHAKLPEHKEIISSLLGLAQVDKILTSFIPAFEQAVQMPDGSWRLYGNFNLGGTVSGRLSSSDPNLQNIPSNSIWAKLIKSCFGCNNDWLFGGADFNSLEDMVSALITRDTNKMKCYTDGYDGHSLRAFSYFKDQMKGIKDTVKSINSIKDKYPQLRQQSKGPTFALTYQGTSHTLINNLGLDPIVAKQIESNYHELYKESDEWVQEKLQEACSTGYVTGAFGLRLRTPILRMNGKGKLKPKAAAEGRTAGNMLGQSYGQLNSRAANEFRERVWASEYKYDVLLCAQIHDAIYLIWRNTAGVTEWVNTNLIECMQWCGLVELQHPKIKLGAELDIFYPDWSTPTNLKNGMTYKEIIHKCR